MTTVTRSTGISIDNVETTATPYRVVDGFTELLDEADTVEHCLFALVGEPNVVVLDVSLHVVERDRIRSVPDADRDVDEAASRPPSRSWGTLGRP